MSAKQNSEKEACNKNFVEITQQDLPLSCPPNNKRVWDAHPRVYFPIAETGEYMCPYCGTFYVLKDVSACQKKF